jgi:hypothetical protein
MTLDDAFDAANNPLVLDLSKLVAERDMPEADAPEDPGEHSNFNLIANGPDCRTRTPPPQVTAGAESETSNPDQHRSRNRKQSRTETLVPGGGP